MTHGYHDNAKTLALLALASQLGFIFEGVFLCMVVLYFLQYRKTDPALLQAIIVLSTTLELAATGLLFSVCWRISSKAISYFPVWEICTIYVLRVPVQLLVQVFFGFRSWALHGKRKIVREIWAALVLFELVLGELTLVFSYQRWTIEDPRPYPVGPLFTTHLMFTSIVNICIASAFARALISMRSPVRQTQKVLFKLITLSFFSNLVVSTLSVTTTILWYYSIDAKFHIPLELLAKAYPINLMLALLTREANRKLIGSTTNGGSIFLDARMDLSLNVDPLHPTSSSSSQGDSPDSPNSVFDRKERSLSFCCTPL